MTGFYQRNSNVRRTDVRSQDLRPRDELSFFSLLLPLSLTPAVHCMSYHYPDNEVLSQRFEIDSQRAVRGLVSLAFALA